MCTSFYDACFATRHVKKFREVTPLGHKVITANMLIFKPIFQCLLLKIVGGGTIVPGKCALGSFCHCLACAKI